MATFEKLSKCPFYQGKMNINSGLGSMYKKKYCEGDKTTCACYIIATQLGPEFVTNILFPNMNDLANKMLAEHKKRRKYIFVIFSKPPLMLLSKVAFLVNEHFQKYDCPELTKFF